MPPIVADAGPLNYLILIEAVDILPRMFKGLLIPEVVAVELSRPQAHAHNAKSKYKSSSVISNPTASSVSFSDGFVSASNLQTSPARA